MRQAQQRSAALLLPNPITAAMIAAGTSVPVVDGARGEAAWDEDFAYTGQQRSINYMGRLYESVGPSRGVPPDEDTQLWRTTGPSNRMAPFDHKSNRAAKARGVLVFVIRPGFFNGLALYGLVGERLEILLYDKPGGKEIYRWAGDMYEQAFGLFEYLYMPLRQIKKRLDYDLEMAPDAELVIRITASNDGWCEIGRIVCGFWESLLGNSGYGGVEYEAQAQVKTYSTFSDEGDGEFEIVARGSATNINCRVVISADEGNRAADLLLKVGSMPVAIVLAGMPRYEYLNTFGLISGNVSPANYGEAVLDISVKGYVL